MNSRLGRVHGAAVAGDVGREALADSLAGGGFGRLAERLDGAVEAFLETRPVFDFLARDELSAFLEEIPAPELEGVHPQRLRDEVHLVFVGEAELVRAHPAHGVGDGVVGEVAVAPDFGVGHLVGAGGDAHAAEEKQVRFIGVRSRVADNVGLDCEDFPLLRGGGAVAHHKGMFFRRGAEALLAAHGHVRGPPGQVGQQRQIGFDGEHPLRPESAADVGAQVADPALRNGQHHRHRAVVLDQLGPDPDGEDAVLLDPGGPRGGLEESVFGELGLVGALDDDVGLRESAFGVSARNLEIADPALLRAFIAVAGGPHPLPGLDLELNGRDARFEGVSRLGAHDGERVAGELDHVLDEDGLTLMGGRVRAEAEILSGDVLGGEDGRDARNPLGGGGVDALEAAVRHRGEEDPAVKRPVGEMVLPVGHRAVRFRNGVVADIGFSDQIVTGHGIAPWDRRLK